MVTKKIKIIKEEIITMLNKDIKEMKDHLKIILTNKNMIKKMINQSKSNKDLNKMTMKPIPHKKYKEKIKIPKQKLQRNKDKLPLYQNGNHKTNISNTIKNHKKINQNQNTNINNHSLEHNIPNQNNQNNKNNQELYKHNK